MVWCEDLYPVNARLTKVPHVHERGFVSKSVETKSGFVVSIVSILQMWSCFGVKYLEGKTSLFVTFVSTLVIFRQFFDEMQSDRD